MGHGGFLDSSIVSMRLVVFFVVSANSSPSTSAMERSIPLVIQPGGSSFVEKVLGSHSSGSSHPKSRGSCTIKGSSP